MLASTAQRRNGGFWPYLWHLGQSRATGLERRADGIPQDTDVQNGRAAEGEAERLKGKNAGEVGI